MRAKTASFTKLHLTYMTYLINRVGEWNVQSRRFCGTLFRRLNIFYPVRPHFVLIHSSCPSMKTSTLQKVAALCACACLSLATSGDTSILQLARYKTDHCQNGHITTWLAQSSSRHHGDLRHANHVMITHKRIETRRSLQAFLANVPLAVLTHGEGASFEKSHRL